MAAARVLSKTSRRGIDMPPAGAEPVKDAFRRHS
jgi:hypothetical protein